MNDGMVKRILGRCKVEANGCIVWQGSRAHRKGRLLKWQYGKMTVGSRPRATKLVHRVMYESAVGEIPAGLWVLHTCDNPGCCNPQHLFLGTCLTNMQDAARKGRMPSGEHHCWSKLVARDIPLIRAMRKSGWSLPQLSRKFGVTAVQIRNVCLRISWGSISDSAVLQDNDAHELSAMC